MAWQDGFEPLFTFEQREPAQIVAVSRVMVPTLPARAPPPVPPQQLQTLGFGIERAPEAAEMRLSGPMTGEQKLGEDWRTYLLAPRRLRPARVPE